MATLRDQIEYAIRDAMAQSGGMIENWDDFSFGKASDLRGAEDEATIALRWVSALHQSVLTLATEIDALKATASAG